MAKKGSNVFVCPNCGAENKYSGNCAYCGTPINVSGIKSKQVESDDNDLSNKFVAQSYDKFEGKKCYALIKFNSSIYDLYEPTLIREVFSDGRDELYLCVRTEHSRHKNYYHFDTSTLYIKAGKNIYEVEGDERSCINYEDKTEKGYFKIDKNILRDICRADIVSFKVKCINDKGFSFEDYKEEVYYEEDDEYVSDFIITEYDEDVIIKHIEEKEDEVDEDDEEDDDDEYDEEEDDYTDDEENDWKERVEITYNNVFRTRARIFYHYVYDNSFYTDTVNTVERKMQELKNKIKRQKRIAKKNERTREEAERKEYEEYVKKEDAEGRAILLKGCGFIVGLVVIFFILLLIFK